MSFYPPSRRAFLLGSTATVALPWLESWGASKRSLRAQVAGSGEPTLADRLVCVSPLLGLHPHQFFPGVQDPVLRRPLVEAGLEGQFTTISGLDHKGALAGAHGLAHALYTGTASPSISLDQLAAPRLGAVTRYESLQVTAGDSQQRPTLSFTKAGVALPAISRPSELFVKLFGAGEQGKQREASRLDSGTSLLDELVGQARSVRARVDAADRDRLEEYLESVRSVEQRLARRREWVNRERPEPPDGFALPDTESTDGSMLLENADLVWDLLTLALQNDTTRVVSFSIPMTLRALKIGDRFTSSGYHNLTHHGNDPARIAELLQVESRHMRGAARLMRALASTPLGEGRTLLDSTVVLFGSAVGDASTHVRRNFPLLVAGGGFRHRGHLACAGVEAPNEMACDLFVSVLHRLGFDDESFGSSASNLDRELT